ncbi:hypothetical protein V6N13_035318 [Hibiscus sabdariffa]
MDNLGSVGLSNLCHRRNSTNDVGWDVGNYMAAPFDFVVADEISFETAENGYYEKNRVLTNSTSSKWSKETMDNGRRHRLFSPIVVDKIKTHGVKRRISARSQEKSSKPEQAWDFCPSTDRLMPLFEFSFDEKLLQESSSIVSLLDQIPTAPMTEEDMHMGLVKELDLEEMISSHPNI